ncbi:hypothetical protein PROFUN_16490, partial [Planoprotostelium fungivorum]
ALLQPSSRFWGLFWPSQVSRSQRSGRESSQLSLQQLPLLDSSSPSHHTKQLRRQERSELEREQKDSLRLRLPFKTY